VEADLPRAIANEVAEAIAHTARGLWAAEWARADLCAVLESICDEATFRTLARDVVGVSHRNLHNWAALARYFPLENRSPEYSFRTHLRWWREDFAKEEEEHLRAGFRERALEDRQRFEALKKKDWVHTTTTRRET